MSPVAGLIEAGPVDPLQLPSEFTQITNQRSLSIGLPGPTIGSHQPASGFAPLAAACASGERPVTIRIALSRAALSSPQVSKATRALRNSPPRFIAKGEGRSK